VRGTFRVATAIGADIYCDTVDMVKEMIIATEA
jgi:hypothetical protein